MMVPLLKHISLCVFFFYAFPVLAYGTKQQGTMIIAYEYGCVETLNGKLRGENDGFGATLSLVVTALYQEAGPLLVPAPLWHALVQHKNLFDVFAESDSLDDLQERYGSFNYFNAPQAIAQFKAGATYLNALHNRFTEYIYQSYPGKTSKLERLIREDPLFDETAAPAGFDPSSRVWRDLLCCLMCSRVPLERYLVKKVIHKDCSRAAFYLFIPYAYLAERSIPVSKSPVLQNFQLTYREQAIGLKIDHYPDVANAFALVGSDAVAHAEYNDAFIGVVNDLFVHQQETQSPCDWVVYMLGHGNFSQEAYASVIQQNILIGQYEKELKQLQAQRKRSRDYYSSLKKRKRLSTDPRLCTAEKSLMAIEKAIAQKETKISQAQALRDFMRMGNCVAGISSDQFRDFLLFLDQFIKTRLFFYSTCSAGGEHFISAFSYSDGKPYRLSYAVLADALVEAPSTSEPPELPLSYYHNQLESWFWPIPFDKLVDWKNSALTLYSVYDFPAFFHYAHATPVTPSTVQGMLSSVSPLHKSCSQQPATSLWQKLFRNFWQSLYHFYKQFIHFVIGDIITFDQPHVERDAIKNIPSLRLAQSASFRVIQAGQRFFVLTGKPDLFDQQMSTLPTADVVFLYADSYGTVEIDKIVTPIFPAFVSMIPGGAQHAFDALRAPAYSFSEVVASFFACPQLNVTKIFYFKELSCIQDISVKDVPYASLQNFRHVYCMNKKPKSSASGQAHSPEVAVPVLGQPSSEECRYVNEVGFTLGSQQYVATWGADQPFPKNFCQSFIAQKTSQYQILQDYPLEPRNTGNRGPNPIQEELSPLSLQEASQALNAHMS